MPAYVAVLIASMLVGPGEANGVAVPSPLGQVPARTVHAATLRGVASWYATGPQGPGHAAADARLQHWLGRHWRGSIVKVCNLSRSSCVRVTVDDTCGCPGHRVIDLNPEDFVILAPTSLGVTDVVVLR